MRELTSHKLSCLNDALKVQVLDEPGAGNACHRYHITTVECAPPPEVDPDKCMSMLQAVTDIQFQEGPIAEVGVNGISNEALLAIVQDRLEGFQSGPYACHENQEALRAVHHALLWLHLRTYLRTERGVEGTSAP